MIRVAAIAAIVATAALTGAPALYAADKEPATSPADEPAQTREPPSLPKPRQPVSRKADSPMEKIREYAEEQVAAGKIDKDSPNWKMQLPKFPTTEFPADANYSWNLQTNKGSIRVKLLPKVAPNHVANFIYLSELGFFDGLAFHRVITGFMAQGGCPRGDGRGSPGYRFDGETSPAVKHDKPGLLSMANAGPGTDGSQFFLTFVPCPWLDGKHTVFGEVISGKETLQALEKCGSRSGQTSEKLFIEKAWITEDR